MFHLVGIFKTSSPEDSILNNPEKHALRRQRKEPGNIEVSQQKADSLNIKRLLLIKENQISQVKEFSTFLCMGGCKKESGLTEIIPFISVSAIRGQHLMFFTSWAPLGSLYGVAATWWLLDLRYSSTSWVPLCSDWRSGIADNCGLWHHCSLIWQEIFHFSHPTIWEVFIQEYLPKL